MEDLRHVVWGCKRGAGMVLFGYNSKRQHGLEVPGLVRGAGRAQLRPHPNPSRSTTYTAQLLQKDLGSQDEGPHTFSILLESLPYRSLLLSSL